jgi:hypothetical protein
MIPRDVGPGKASRTTGEAYRNRGASGTTSEGGRPARQTRRLLSSIATSSAPENNRAPVSNRRIMDNLGNIRPKDVKCHKLDLEAAFEWAKSTGYATLAAQQPKKGEWYDLHPVPAAKF